MAILPVLQFPDERLRKKAKSVDHITNETQRIISDMIETMYSQDGIGLAATQVNIHQRIIVIDVSQHRDQIHVMINPTLIEQVGEAGIEEGCLSVPGIRSFVHRAEKVKVKALNREGQFYEMDADGILAICLQHELDHLDGKLFIDYLSRFKRDRINRKFDKLSKRVGH